MTRRRGTWALWYFLILDSIAEFNSRLRLRFGRRFLFDCFGLRFGLRSASIIGRRIKGRRRNFDEHRGAEIGRNVRIATIARAIIHQYGEDACDRGPLNSFSKFFCTAYARTNIVGKPRGRNDQ